MELDAINIVDTGIETKKPAESFTPGLTCIMYHGSRTEDGAAGYAIVCKKDHTWKGHKEHMGYNAI